MTSNTRSCDKNRILQVHHVGREACLLSGAAFQRRRQSALPYVTAQSVYVDVAFARLCGENEMLWLGGYQLIGRELNED